MPEPKGRYACRHCGHDVADHTPVNGCPHCRCGAHPSEARPVTEAQYDARVLLPHERRTGFEARPAPAPRVAPLRTVVREARACVQAEGGHLDQTVRIGLRDLDALALFVEQAAQVAEQHDPPRGHRPRQECVCHLCVLVREAGWLNQGARLRERYQEVFGG